jgi:hypothetical protein
MGEDAVPETRKWSMDGLGPCPSTRKPSVEVRNTIDVFGTTSVA